jgi:hypothetical protein
MININDFELINEMCDLCIYNYKSEIRDIANRKRGEINANFPEHSHSSHDRMAYEYTKLRNKYIKKLKEVAKLQNKLKI